ncbi:MAG: glycerophosphodiester phosphodiesterase family protein [Clostridiales bacterium]|nr:glycerophosphodiester phosphodiesterase family protein [Clostridiales bacterium]
MVNKTSKKIKILPVLAVGALVVTSSIFGGVGGISALAQTQNNNIVDTYQSQSSLVNEPTVVAEVTSAAHLEELCSAEERPSNVILQYDNYENICDSSGNKIGTMEEVMAILNNKVLPIFSIESSTSAYNFISYMSTEVKILDIAVTSSDATIIKDIKSDISCRHVRGILRIDETYELAEAVQIANVNAATIVIMPQSMATINNVRYLQARFKTVWVDLKDTSGLNIQNAINSGAYGVISTTPADIYSTLNSYEGGYTRTPFNVAHRGLPKTHNENSISGTIAAIEGGATHVELDVFLSTDNQLFLMHDDTLDRTSNGTGNPSKMTLAQIQQYKLDLFGEEKIPTLDEAFEVIKESEVVLVLELKTSDTNIIEPLRAKIEEYDMWDQMVVISFYLPQLEKMYEVIPEIPTANLNTASKSTFADVIDWMGKYNTGINTSNGNDTAEFNEKYLRDRGIIGWYYTYDTYEKGVTDASGIIGLTNNGAATALGKVMYADSFVGDLTEVAVGQTVTLNATTYEGAEKQVEGTVIAVEQNGANYSFICKYEDNGLTLYTQALTIEKGGCAGSISASTFVLTALGASLVLICKKHN